MGFRLVPFGDLAQHYWPAATINSDHCTAYLQQWVLVSFSN